MLTPSKRLTPEEQLGRDIMQEYLSELAISTYEDMHITSSTSQKNETPVKLLATPIENKRTPCQPSNENSATRVRGSDGLITASQESSILTPNTTPLLHNLKRSAQANVSAPPTEARSASKACTRSGSRDVGSRARNANDTLKHPSLMTEERDHSKSAPRTRNVSSAVTSGTDTSAAMSRVGREAIASKIPSLVQRRNTSVNPLNRPRKTHAELLAGDPPIAFSSTVFNNENFFHLNATSQAKRLALRTTLNVPEKVSKPTPGIKHSPFQRPSFVQADYDITPTHKMLVDKSASAQQIHSVQRVSTTRRDLANTSAFRQTSVLKHRDTIQGSAVRYNYLNVTLDPSKYSQDIVKRHAAATILRYLEFRHFPEQLSIMEVMRCESIALYQNLMTFLSSQFGPLPTYDRMKFDDRVPKFYKDLGYPSTLAKSHMISPCTLSTWPQHLVAMTWLACLAYFDAKVLMSLAQPQVKVQTTNEAHTPRHFFPDLTRNSERVPSTSMYQRDFFIDPMNTCLRGESVFRLDKTESQQAQEPDSPTNAVIKTLQTGYIFYREKKGCLDQQELNKTIEPALANILSRVDAEKKEAQQAYKEVTGKWTARQDLMKELGAKQEALARLNRDKQIIEDTIKTTQLRLRQEQQKTANILALCEAKGAKATFMKNEIETVRERVRTQEISKDELNPLLQKIDSHKKLLEAKRHEKQNLETSIREMSVRITTIQDTLQGKVRVINQHLNKLRSTSPSSKPSEDLWPEQLQLYFEALDLDKAIEIQQTSSRFQSSSQESPVARGKQVDGGSVIKKEHKMHIEHVIKSILGVRLADWTDSLTQLIQTKQATLCDKDADVKTLEAQYLQSEKLKKNKRRSQEVLQEDLKKTRIEVQEVKAKLERLRAEREKAEKFADQPPQATKEDKELISKNEALELELNKRNTEIANLREKLKQAQDTHTRNLQKQKEQILEAFSRIEQQCMYVANELNTDIARLNDYDPLPEAERRLPDLLSSRSYFGLPETNCL